MKQTSPLASGLKKLKYNVMKRILFRCKEDAMSYREKNYSENYFIYGECDRKQRWDEVFDENLCWNGEVPCFRVYDNFEEIAQLAWWD